MAGTKDLTGRGEIQALLGKGTEFEGVLVFEGRVRVDGAFRGKVFGGVLILGDGADVEAEVQVDTLIVRGGTLRGDVKASQLVEIHADGAVHGDIEAPQFDIDKGCVFEGKVQMPREPEPTSSHPASAAPPDSAPPADADEAGDDPGAGPPTPS